MFDVSVIVLTYNSKWEKLKYTLESIVKQEKINLQILIADDGSLIKFDEQIRNYMNERSFSNYIIVNNEMNSGTVINIANALQFVEGEYTKLISPGDYLYASDTLSIWINWMKTNCINASFGDAIYYSEYNNMEFIKNVGSPVNKTIYGQNFEYSKVFVDYLVANDTILGATQLIESRLLNDYITQIKGKVKYAEDYILRLMIFDGVKIQFYNHTVIMYEYGRGISTAQNESWKKILHQDFKMSDQILLNRHPQNFEQRKYKMYLSCRNTKYFIKFIKVTLFPCMIFYRFKMKIAKECIPKDANEKQAKWIGL